MGEVYLAQHPRLPRQGALKILRAGVSADDEYRQRFEREADIAATLVASAYRRKCRDQIRQSNGLP